MTFEEYKQRFQEYVTDTGLSWSHTFYQQNRNFRSILFDMKNHRETSKRFQGLSQDELLVLLYKANVLKEPLDKTFTRLQVNDTVITALGSLYTITHIMPSSRVKIRLKGGMHEKTTLASNLLKVLPQVNLEL